MVTQRLLHCLFLLALIQLGARGWSPSPKCQTQLDRFCATDCYAKIKARPCDGSSCVMLWQARGRRVKKTPEASRLDRYVRRRGPRTKATTAAVTLHI